MIRRFRKDISEPPVQKNRQGREIDGPVELRGPKVREL
jgi:hypothetical protein